MYIQRQRKNLKSCLSFSRHDSKVPKNSLRKLRFSKRIQILYKLLFHGLPVFYKMDSIQDCIAQAVLATPLRVPSSCNPWEIYPDPFPDHLFPQLRSLKRAIAKQQRLKQMEPLNWQAGIRPDRPFEPLHNNFFFSQPQPRPRPPPPPQQPRSQRQIPTQYYLEQAPFYAENFGPDPYATEPEIIQPGPLKVLSARFNTIFRKAAIQGLNILASLVSGLIVLGRLLSSWALRFPLKKICALVPNFVSNLVPTNLEWEALVAMALAIQCAKLLPGMGGEVMTDGREGDGPVYTIFVGRRRAIVNGPVMPGGF
ncbi:hypothetical protein BGZ57DRAFT_287634 [Hyaloscypha finlandica]|nr:hypothetical protein BGZ57DRAFT_287634 [Hyaloscypha finlandica]